MSTVRDWLEGKHAERSRWVLVPLLAVAALVLAYQLGQSSVEQPEPTADYASLDQRIEEMQATIDAMPKAQPVNSPIPVRLFGTIKQQWTNAREMPSAEARIMHTYDAGELVEIHDQRDGWVLSGDGWIRETLVEF